MKNKKLLTGFLAVLSCVSLASCSNKKEPSTREKKKIGIGLYTLTGTLRDTLEKYLNTIKDSQNLEFSFFETGYDANSLLSAVNQQIASGVDGIISTMDGGEAILEACAEAKVYYSGFLCDFESSFDELKDQDYFLGTAVDGAYRGTAWGEHIAERVIKEGKKNVGLIKFPAYAYPHQDEMDIAFRAKIDQYNATAAEADKIKYQNETTEMPFFGFDLNSYMASNEGIDAIYAMCGGVDSIYPSMTDAQKKSIALYTAGYNVNITSAIDFGEGNCIQEMVYCNNESIVYPLVMMLNKFDGKDFQDNPAEAQRVETSQIIIQTKADLDFVQAHSIYHTGKEKDAFLNAEEFNSLLAVNGGTHEKLVKTVQSMTLQDLKTRNA